MTFKKGQSGNAAGRKPGTQNKKLELLRSNDKRLQKKILKLALDGDPTALRIVADRLWPRLRAEATPIKIKSAASSDLTEQGRELIRAALSGDITVDALRDVLTALYGQAKLVELTELEARLRALEETPPMPPWQKANKPTRELFPIRGKRRRTET